MAPKIQIVKSDNHTVIVMLVSLFDPIKNSFSPNNLQLQLGGQ
ncbi:hypothetical protein VAEU17_3180007 [Vibrio aestuarianus]|nr:hypothetical protein VAEU17_3180007 [Vibrio aestuarianus]